jgi:hypothetical protein
MSTPQELHAAKLSELAARVADIDAQVASLDSDYADLAADFPNNGALKRAAAIESRVTTLRREKALALAATARIEQEQRAATLAAEQAAKAQRASAARQLAEQICACHEAIDATLKALCEACARRVNLLAALGRSELVDPQLIMKLSGRAPMTRACCAANLHVHVELQAVSPQGRLPLSSCNELLQGIGRERGNGQAAPPQPTRVRLGS